MTGSFNIIDVFLQSVIDHPESIALEYGDKQITYSQLGAEAQATAAYYKSRGIEKGDRVLVFIPMSIDLYRIVLALFSMGAVPVFLDQWVDKARLKQCLQIVRCRAIVGSWKLLALSFFIKETRQIPIKIFASAKGKTRATVMNPATIASDTALITFTTGSTGLPKAANRTHAFLHAQMQALKPLLGGGPSRSLTLLPIVVLVNLGLGKSVLLPPPGFKIKDSSTVQLLNNLIRQHNLQSIIASPAILLEMAATLQAHDTMQVSQIITGGGPVFPDEAWLLNQVFSNASRQIVFGSTEAEPISIINAEDLFKCKPDEVLNYGLPVGKTDRSIDVAIIPVTENRIENMSGAQWNNYRSEPEAVGEIVVSGDHVLQSYIGNEPGMPSNKFLVNDKLWHRTGDAGRINQSGELFFLGRCNEIIQLPDTTIYPLLVTYAFKLATNRAAAILKYKQDLYLIIEGFQPVHPSIVAEILGPKIADEIILHNLLKMPRDPRHRTKIDYQKLRQELSLAFGT